MGSATFERRAIVVPDRLAMRVRRLAVARAAHHGSQVLSFPQLAARLAGGFVQSADDDALYRAVSDCLPTVDLGDLEAIRFMPGTPSAVMATLRKAWDASLDLEGRAGDHARISALQRVDIAVRAGLPKGMLVPPALAQAAQHRIEHAKAIFGTIECDRLGNLAPCWRPLLLALARVLPVRWLAGARPVPEWLDGSGVEVVREAGDPAPVHCVSAADAAHEALEAMRWARALLASGQAKPEEIAIAAASTASFDDHFLGLREQAEFDLHFVHGVPAASIRAGQQAASLADVLVNGLTLPRLRRLARVNASAPLFARLPQGWLRALPAQFAPRNVQSWERAINGIQPADWPDATDHGPDLRLVVNSLLGGAAQAEVLGPQVLERQALSLWRRALLAGPAQALMANLAPLRLDDAGEPCASVCWMPASALAATPRPYVRLLGLNSGLWPRAGNEDRLLPSHIVAARELEPESVPASERADFAAILGASRGQVVLSHARRDNRGRHISRSALLQPFGVPDRLTRHAVPVHAMGECDRLLARPSEFRDGAQAVSAFACWRNWQRAEVTRHDGLIAHDRPVLCFLAERTQSASSLRKLLRYPLGYVWQYGLGWRNPDEASEALVLDARLSGLLIHRVLQLMLQSESDAGLDDRQRVEAVMRSVQAEWEASQQVPPVQIWRRTLADAQALALTTLSTLRQRERGMSLFAEVPFGDGTRAGAEGLPWPNDAPVPIPGTGLAMRGYIDRLALSSDRSLAYVVDYKTGKELKEGTVLDGGAELQRSLYALAVRSMLGEGTEVHASLLYLYSQKELVLSKPEVILEDLAGYLSLARTNLEAGRAVVGPDAGGAYDDFALLLPAQAQAMYWKRKRDAVAQTLGEAAAVWEVT
ncbi:PD-(D/E)XK nuclease family protein [Massilia timonae]|uniref:PD-(D/E)XK nuclease family protein n=1 Tax=Massilia timonae TaxID=47229 RepID=UPI00289A2D81|nr:PD-(D/E)XK nuclease family protein [Massilia timonae]